MEIIVSFFGLCFINAYCCPVDVKTANFSMKKCIIISKSPLLNTA